MSAELLATAQKAVGAVVSTLPKGWRVTISSSRQPGFLFFVHDDGGTTALIPKENWPTTVPDFWPAKDAGDTESVPKAGKAAPATPAAPVQNKRSSPGTPDDSTTREPNAKKPVKPD
eukprot:5522471-Pyramimonas_sp.AAC.1